MKKLITPRVLHSAPLPHEDKQEILISYRLKQLDALRFWDRKESKSINIAAVFLLFFSLLVPIMWRARPSIDHSKILGQVYFWAMFTIVCVGVALFAYLLLDDIYDKFKKAYEWLGWEVKSRSNNSTR